MSKTDKSIVAVLVDDDESHLELLELSLTNRHVRDHVNIAPHVLKFTDPIEALTNMPTDRTAVIFCDYRMPGASGLDWLPDFVNLRIGPVFVLTAQGDEQIAATSFKLGANDYLIKSRVFDDPEYVAHAVNDALRRFELETRNRELTNELRRFNRELESKNARLSELTDTAHRFVDNVAHEFRTPLTVIREFAAIMNDGLGGEVTTDQQEFLTHIIAATRDLAQMVDDFLDSSKLKTHSLRVDRRVHRIADIFDAVRVTLQTRAAPRRISLDEHIAPDLGEVFCDLETAGRVIINLTVNAIKFSNEGDQVQLWAIPDQNGDVRVGVTDHGPGLTDEDLAVVCERFRQIGNAQSTCTKGFGLGLNIAKELVWLNFGRMQIDSELGKGSTFAFTLPSANPQRILESYVQTLRSVSDDANICMLEVTADDPASPIAPMRDFLCGVCHAQDLVMPCDNHRSVILLGPTIEPDKWMLRLHGARATVAKRFPDAAPPALNVQMMGAWACDKQERALISAALGRITAAKACA